MQARVRQYSILRGIMVESDADVIRNAKSAQRSLLQRYDIPVEHLSYEYISKCENTKKLEHIVTILRSGEEGHYPDLLKYAEKRLSVIKPISILLRKSEPILKRSMLEPDECKEIDKNMNDWISEMQIREKSLEEGKVTISNLFTPDIRKFQEQCAKKYSLRNFRSAKDKRITSCDYAAWDNYDVDTELNKIDIQDEQQKVEAKKLQQKQKQILKKQQVGKSIILDKTTMTGTELNLMAEQEKEKGNEAYKAGDYEEALKHYDTSIKINSNIIACYTNRAITYIKLQRYEDALNDCNTVLSKEHTNIKALLRRALSLEHLGDLSQALADYEAALKLAPNDTSAIAGVKRLRKLHESKTVRMTIKEEQTGDTNKRSRSDEIEICRNFFSLFGSQFNLEDCICFCDRAPGPSHCLSPRPHIKGEYCFEDDNRNETIKTSKESNSAQKVINLNTVPTKNSSNSSSNIPREKSNPVLNTKQKSIFSFTRPARTSSVIIEELPNEPSNNKYANVRIKSNKKVANENTEDTNKSQTNTDKQAEVPNAKNLNKNSEQSGNSNKKVKVADKYKNKTSKPEKYIPKKFGKIENGYEFMRMWRSLKNDTDLEVYAQLLRSLDVNKLNSILGNELDGNMFSTILHCLERYFCTSSDTELLSNFLKSFCQVNRFSIVNMFMSREDKRVIKNILNFLEEHGASGISSLRQIYCI
ncbi:spag1 axonemal dynein assembly factor [Bombus fervidus]|uniref:spag1 axonemal dynein assembly factor n=1 Tax=Bombus fervidus TaxID=203811 RepID=UPI003AB6F5EA